ncbi:hypothetical protein Tco_0724284 [Tanacetum coccineum]
MPSSSLRPSASTRPQRHRDSKTSYSSISVRSEKTVISEQPRRIRNEKTSTPCYYFKKLPEAVWESKDDDRLLGVEKTVGGPVTQQNGYSALTARDLTLCHGMQTPKRTLYWLEDTYEEIDEQGIEAIYTTWQRSQEVLYLKNPEILLSQVPVKGYQNAAEVVDYSCALANLIANLTLDTEENKTVLKQLKKANATISVTSRTEGVQTNLMRVIHTTSVSRPQFKCYQVKDKVVPNNSQVQFKKKEVEDHHRISRYLNDVNTRTKKPNVVPISASKPKRKANKSVATPHKKTVASDTTIQKSKSYYKELYENTNQEWKWWLAKRCPSGYTWTQKPLRTKKIWMPKIRKDNESTSISPTIDIVSRITNVLVRILEHEHIAPILGYGVSDLKGMPRSKHWFITSKASITIFLGWLQFCDSYKEFFQKSTCFCERSSGNLLRYW